MTLVRKIHPVAFQMHTRLLMLQHTMGTNSVALTYTHMNITQLRDSHVLIRSVFGLDVACELQEP